MSSLRQFFVHYGQLFTGHALSLTLGLISFPILTRIMKPEEYGVLGLVTSTMLLMVALAKAGLSDGIIRFYKKYSGARESRAIFSSTIVVRGLVLALVVTGLYLLLFPRVGPYLGIKPEYIGTFLMMGAYLFVRPMNIVVLNVLRASGRILFFTVINFIGKITAITLSLVIFIYYIHEVYGYFIGVVLSEVAVAVVLYYWYFKHNRISTTAASSDLALRLIRFGAPLMITELSYLLLIYVDRYMVMHYYGEAALGMYSVGYNLASYIGDAIMFPLSYAVIPLYVSLFQSQGQEATRQFLGKCLHYLLVAAIPISVGYLAIAEELIVTLASEKYMLASTFSPVILLATLFLAANYILNAGLYLHKKSVVLLAIMLATVMVNIVANLVFLSRYGIDGAAYAKLIAAAFSSLATVVFSYRYLAIPVNVRTLMYYAALSAVMYALVAPIHVEQHWLSLILKITAGAGIIVPGILLREKELRDKLVELWRKSSSGTIS